MYNVDDLRNNLRNLSVRLAGATALCVALGCSAAMAADQQTPPKQTSGNGSDERFAWGGLHWGVGVGVTFDIQRQHRIGEAIVVNNIVRIKEEKDVGIALVLEAHYFFTGRGAYVHPNWGHGPFVAIEITGDSQGPGKGTGVINAYAIGYMVGFRQPKFLADGTRTYEYSGNASWNFGIGVRVDANAKTLGDGIVANQPLPPNEPAEPVRIKTVPRYGLMLISSFSF